MTEECRFFGTLIAPQVDSNGDEPYKCGATILCHLEDKVHLFLIEGLIFKKEDSNSAKSVFEP